MVIQARRGLKKNSKYIPKYQDKIAKAGNNHSCAVCQLCQLVCGWEPEAPTFLC